MAEGYDSKNGYQYKTIKATGALRESRSLSIPTGRTIEWRAPPPKEPDAEELERRRKIWDEKMPAGLSHTIVCNNCGCADSYPLGKLDPKEGRCIHNFKWDMYSGRRGAMSCSNCTLTIPVESLPSRYNPNDNKLADDMQMLKDENVQVLAENARLRRQLEAAARKK